MPTVNFASPPPSPSAGRLLADPRDLTSLTSPNALAHHLQGLACLAQLKEASEPRRSAPADGSAWLLSTAAAAASVSKCPSVQVSKCGICYITSSLLAC
ncbi:hypothetical protein PG995_001644 [Apiospora arundinis]